jgi:acylglycerol lipase
MTFPPAHHLPIKYGFDPSREPPPLPPVMMTQSLVDNDKMTAPEEEVEEEGHFYPSFDHRLWMFYRLWKPSSSSSSSSNVPIRASLLIVHGTVDHSGVYRELAHALTRVGIVVIAMDLRGWGLSDGESMYLHHLETFCQDVQYLSEDVIHTQSRFQHIDPSRRFLLGKSIGGLITANSVGGRYSPNHHHWQGGLIGLSGAYQPDPSILPHPVVTFLLQKTYVGRLVPHKLPLKYLVQDEHMIVSDEAALEAWRKDPLCCKDKLRVGYGLEALRAMQELIDTPLPSLNLPLLLLIGTDDQVVTGEELLMNQCTSHDKILLKYETGRHNLLQEPRLKDQVIQDIVSWIQERIV